MNPTILAAGPGRLKTDLATGVERGRGRVLALSRSLFEAALALAWTVIDAATAPEQRKRFIAGPTAGISHRKQQ
ncbi:MULTISPECIES: hypothetical protein [unclassified Streptomyces]|uniref:hypothetical protein n=1 Tax=unclassified Streptomyces TaxID=2593676 RepID=UPI002DDC37B7|nr:MULTISPECIES: hypothetical protein [unclassified Streptomyces]WSA95549.1 hypothetical protein OIE63_31250 [Streptomyces sp. NBC_01795]WSB79963.1 hypothetical protein OHB04_32360 [Streptomyces sp. NBC_01775]WSS11829.1 hypothetical protein OG533_07850 [Streptomyces sp. NBC_01186]WSS40542.1 hypothetical protein OG220_08000 [Streptomyces sp. NBC_01187]